MVRVPNPGTQLDISEVILIQNLQAGNYQSETPAGTIDGANTSFTLAAAPSPASSLFLFANGSRLAAAGVDFTLTGAAISFNFPPQPGTILAAYYLRDTP